MLSTSGEPLVRRPPNTSRSWWRAYVPSDLPSNRNMGARLKSPLSCIGPDDADRYVELELCDLRQMHSQMNRPSGRSCLAATEMIRCVFDKAEVTFDDTRL